MEHIVECNPGIAEGGYDRVGSHVIGKKLQERELWYRYQQSYGQLVDRIV